MGVTLREGDREFFYAQLDKHFPGMKEQYMRRFGNAYECPSPNQARLMTIFRESCAKYDVMYEPNQIFRLLAGVSGMSSAVVFVFSVLYER